MNDLYNVGFTESHISMRSFSWKRQICEITRQIGEDRKLRISLSNKYIENLADTINEKKRIGTKNKNSDDTGKRTIAAIYSEYQS